MLGIPFNIEFKDITLPIYCPVLGLELNYSNSKPLNNSPSVDRVIPQLGYIKDNIRIISMRANLLKKDASPEELEKIAKYAKNETKKVKRKFNLV